ncbi:protein FAM110C [Myripristis murdjan]|uniref:protein FAM110C n=1 Tax=Myripristis murdjan TaxID=586833 RepID=UPI0011762475|nr:protein FAM110C [Myripristis murdjan]
MESSGDVDASKILEKGPEYLRKQMELESEAKGGMSAVERLAASKLKYVKSQQVVNSTQEPVISLGSASVSSTGSSNRSSNRSGKLVPGRNLPVVSGGAQSHSQGQDNVVRRSSSKKRPDSLLLYRQKCELLKRSTNDRDKRSKARRLLLSSVDKNVSLPEATDKECMSEGDDVLTPKGSANECQSNDSHSEQLQQQKVTDQESPRDREPVRKAAVLRKPNHRRVAEVQQRSRTGVSRSHSDISSRYSKNFADFDAFFKYCGLDGEVIESLGKENFSARSDELAIKIRSVSVSTSDDGFSRSSGDSDGLLEEELHENIRQGTSVIERNARIIKWLYSCKNAKETGKKLRELH